MVKPLLIFDFDGVLCDTQGECLVVSYYAYQELKKYSFQRDYKTESIPPEQVKLFYNFRPLVRCAPEYYLLWELIFQELPIDEKQPLDAQIKTKTNDEYTRLFFNERKTWQTTDCQGWLNYNLLYSGLHEILRKIATTKYFYIVSSKDNAAINLILSHNGFDVNENRIYGLKQNFDKDAHLKEILSVNNVNGSKAFFIDDNLTNLGIAKELSMHTIFAEWGYNFPYQKIKAEHEGIKPLTLLQLSSWLNSVIAS